MATRVSQLEMDLSCVICQEIFNEPVVLSCSHSFCKACLQQWWVEKVVHQCPICKRRSSKSTPPCNLALKNLCETFLQELSLKEKASAPSEALCSLHSEKLRLFCLAHQQLVCIVCRDSRVHTNHRFRPIDEAAEDYKEKLRKSLKPIEEKLEHFQQIKDNWDQTENHIKVQARDAEIQIRNEFDRLRQFLQEEERARITALKKEAEIKSCMMERRIVVLSGEIAALSDTIRATEKELKNGNIPFLQNYKATAEKVQQCPLWAAPQLASGALIDVAKHLGNLAYNIWNKMKDMITYTPVILDPNTAESHLVVSHNLKSVRYTAVEGETQLPKNPERFDNYTTVVGCEGFSTGTHSWDVEVVNETDWAVGVISESVPWTGDILTGYWEIFFQDGKYRAFAPPLIDKILSVRNLSRRIRVHLDLNQGKLSFTDPDTKTHIYTFSLTFTGRLFPFLNTLNPTPLSICSVKITTQLEM